MDVRAWGAVAGAGVWERDVRTLRIVDYRCALGLTDASWWGPSLRRKEAGGGGEVGGRKDGRVGGRKDGRVGGRKRAGERDRWREGRGREGQGKGHQFSH